MNVWYIRKYDGNDEIDSWKIRYHYFSNNQIEELLKRLVSSHLSEEEIINSSLNGNAKNKPKLLSVKNDGGVLRCGENPHFTATYTKTSISD